MVHLTIEIIGPCCPAATLAQVDDGRAPGLAGRASNALDREIKTATASEIR
jgi:hypothetical protein